MILKNNHKTAAVAFIVIKMVPVTKLVLIYNL